MAKEATLQNKRSSDFRFSANMSFVSSIAYQTDALVYGVGNYRFL